MVVMQTADGTTCRYSLRPSKFGLRLVRACVSYDLNTVIRDGGWRILEVKTEIARKRLLRAFGADEVVMLSNALDKLPARTPWQGRRVDRGHSVSTGFSAAGY